MPNRGTAGVLVVDDHPGQAGSTADVLRAAELDVLTVSSIDAAVDLCQVRRFDAVVLDVNVAGVDAGDFMVRVPDAPAVIVASGTSAARLAEFRAKHPERVFAVLRKPVPPPEMIEVVERSIESTRLLRLDPREWEEEGR